MQTGVCVFVCVCVLCGKGGRKDYILHSAFSPLALPGVCVLGRGGEHVQANYKLG
jgi:hypothetical protein